MRPPGFGRSRDDFGCTAPTSSATEPISARDRRELGLSDVMVWDTERPYHYARWTPDHRLLLGGGDRLVRPGARRRQQFATAVEELRAYFETRLPALSAINTEFAWEGLFAMTPDTLAVHRPASALSPLTGSPWATAGTA